MRYLNPNKLHVAFMEDTTPLDPTSRRAYTLTHSDSTGDLFLTIGTEPNRPQISGWYTRFMRDEVLAAWNFETRPALHVHCHVSGGIVLGGPQWRKDIFRSHMPMVLEAFRYGDRQFFQAHPELDEAEVWVHFQARTKDHTQSEAWGKLADYNTVAETALQQDMG